MVMWNLFSRKYSVHMWYLSVKTWKHAQVKQTSTSLCGYYWGLCGLKNTEVLSVLRCNEAWWLRCYLVTCAALVEQLSGSQLLLLQLLDGELKLVVSRSRRRLLINVTHRLSFTRSPETEDKQQHQNTSREAFQGPSRPDARANLFTEKRCQLMPRASFEISSTLHECRWDFGNKCHTKHQTFGPQKWYATKQTSSHPMYLLSKDYNQIS